MVPNRGICRAGLSYGGTSIPKIGERTPPACFGRQMYVFSALPTNFGNWASSCSRPRPFWECGGERNGARLWIWRARKTGTLRQYLARAGIQSAVAAALCRRTRKPQDGGANKTHTGGSPTELDGPPLFSPRASSRSRLNAAGSRRGGLHCRTIPELPRADSSNRETGARTAVEA